MIGAFEQAVRHLRQSIDQDFPKLLLAFNIREYLDAEERAAFFFFLYSKEASQEYAAHIEDFE